MQKPKAPGTPTFCTQAITTENSKASKVYISFTLNALILEQQQIPNSDNKVTKKNVFAFQY